MDESNNPNQQQNNTTPNTTPLGGVSSSNPGQTNILLNTDGKINISDMPNVASDTKLEDIPKLYDAMSDNYTDIAVNAANNVGDRQQALIGNNFGATNPYMFNTYYEPAATSFASNMRVTGTQAALEEGMKRAQEEAEAKAKAAKQRYQSALAAQQPKTNYDGSSRDANVHVSETDTNKLPYGTTEREVLANENFNKLSEKDRNDYLIEFRTLRAQQQTEAAGITYNWNNKAQRKTATDDTLRKFGTTREQLNAMSKKEKDAFWARKDVGNYWTEQFMRNSLSRQGQGDFAVELFDDIKSDVKQIATAMSKGISAIQDLDSYVWSNPTLAKDATTTLASIERSIREAKTLDDDTKNNAVEILGNMRTNGAEAAEERAQEYLKLLRENKLDDLKFEISKGGSSKGGSLYNALVSLDINDAGGEDKNAFKKSGLRRTNSLGLDHKEFETQDKWAGLEDSFRREINNEFSSAFGVDYDSMEKLAKLQAEKPEDYEYLLNQSAYVLSNETPYEIVTDADKEYFVNGEYKKLDVGDIVFHTIDGTIDADGNYTDPDFENYVNLIKDVVQGKTEYNDETISKLDKYYKSYQKYVAAAMAASAQYGAQVNQDIYGAILSMREDDQSTKNLTLFNPANPESNERVGMDDFKDWFNNMTENERYNTYTALVNKANRERGYLYIYDENSHDIVTKGIKTNGEYTVGKKGKRSDSANMYGANLVDKMSDHQALAALLFIDNQMSKGGIKKDFLSSDEVSAGDSFVNSVFNGINGLCEFTGWAANSALGMFPAALGHDNAFSKRAGELWDGMTTLDEKDNRYNGDRVLLEQYTEDVRKMQRSNLNHLVDTTFNLDYFDVDKNKDGSIEYSKKNYNQVDQGKAFSDMASGMAGFMAEFLLEGAATSGANVLLKGSKSALMKIPQVANGANKIKDIMIAPSIGTRMLDAATTKIGAKVAAEYSDEMTRLLVNSADNILEEAARSSADDILRVGASKTDEIAEGLAKSYLNTADDNARAATRTIGNTERAIDAIQDTVRTEADKVSYVLDGMNNLPEGVRNSLKNSFAVENAANALVNTPEITTRVANKISRAIIDALPSNTVRSLKDAKLFSGLKSSLDDIARSTVIRAGQESVILQKTKIAPHVLSLMDDSAVDLLYKIVGMADGSANKLASSADDIFGFINRKAGKIAKDIAGEKINMPKLFDDIAGLAASTERALSTDDIIQLALKNSSSKGSLLRSTKLAAFLQDRVTDIGRDVIQNYYTPELDENFESHYVTAGQYFTDPVQWGSGLVFDAGISGAKRLGRGLALGHLNRASNRILKNIDWSAPNALDSQEVAKNLTRLNNYKNRAMRLENKIHNGMVPIDKVSSSVQKCNEDIDTAINTLMKGLDVQDKIDGMTKIVNNAADSIGLKEPKSNWDKFKDFVGANDKKRAKIADLKRTLSLSDRNVEAFIQADNAIKAKSMLSFAAMRAHAPNVEKIAEGNDSFWGHVYSKVFNKIKNGEIRLESNLLGKDGLTINVTDKNIAKTEFARGQKVLFDALTEQAIEDLNATGAGGAINTQALRSEMNYLRDRAIANGNMRIDAGDKVRWNYYPLQAVMAENIGGNRALFGFDYGALNTYIHTGVDNSIANPNKPRDTWDAFKVADDITNGNMTHSRALTSRELSKEGLAAGATKEVPYNLSGFNPIDAIHANGTMYEALTKVNQFIDPVQNGSVIINSRTTFDKVNANSSAKRAKIVEEAHATKQAEYKEKLLKKNKVSPEEELRIKEDTAKKSSKIFNGRMTETKRITTSVKNAEEYNAKVKNRIYNDTKYTDVLYLAYGDSGNAAAPARRAEVWTNGKKAYADYTSAEGQKVSRVYNSYQNDVNGLMDDVDIIRNGDKKAVGELKTKYGKQYATVESLARNKSLNTDFMRSTGTSSTITLDDGNQFNPESLNPAIFNFIINRRVNSDISSHNNTVDMHKNGTIDTSRSVGSNVSMGKSAKKDLADIRQFNKAEIDRANTYTKLLGRDKATAEDVRILNKQYNISDSEQRRNLFNVFREKFLDTALGEERTLKDGTKVKAVRRDSAIGKVYDEVMSSTMDALEARVADATDGSGTISLADFIGEFNQHLPVKELWDSSIESTARGVNKNPIMYILTSLKQIQNAGMSLDDTLDELYKLQALAKSGRYNAELGGYKGASERVLRETTEAIKLLEAMRGNEYRATMKSQGALSLDASNGNGATLADTLTSNEIDNSASSLGNTTSTLTYEEMHDAVYGLRNFLEDSEYHSHFNNKIKTAIDTSRKITSDINDLAKRHTDINNRVVSLLGTEFDSPTNRGLLFGKSDTTYLNLESQLNSGSSEVYLNGKYVSRKEALAAYKDGVDGRGFYNHNTFDKKTITALQNIANSGGKNSAKAKQLLDDITEYKISFNEQKQYLNTHSRRNISDAKTNFQSAFLESISYRNLDANDKKTLSWDDAARITDKSIAKEKAQAESGLFVEIAPEVKAVESIKKLLPEGAELPDNLVYKKPEDILKFVYENIADEDTLYAYFTASEGRPLTKDQIGLLVGHGVISGDSGIAIRNNNTDVIPADVYNRYEAMLNENIQSIEDDLMSFELNATPDEIAMEADVIPAGFTTYEIDQQMGRAEVNAELIKRLGGDYNKDLENLSVSLMDMMRKSSDPNYVPEKDLTDSRYRLRETFETTQKHPMLDIPEQNYMSGGYTTKVDKTGLTGSGKERPIYSANINGQNVEVYVEHSLSGSEYTLAIDGDMDNAISYSSRRDVESALGLPEDALLDQVDSTKRRIIKRQENGRESTDYFDNIGYRDVHEVDTNSGVEGLEAEEYVNSQRDFYAAHPEALHAAQMAERDIDVSKDYQKLTKDLALYKDLDAKNAHEVEVTESVEQFREDVIDEIAELINETKITAGNTDDIAAKLEIMKQSVLDEFDKVDPNMTYYQYRTQIEEMFDEQISAAKKGLPEDIDKAAKELADNDPEYRAIKNANDYSNTKPGNGEVNIIAKNGSPLIMDGSIKAANRISLQDLVDMRGETIDTKNHKQAMELRKQQSGKNEAFNAAKKGFVDNYEFKQGYKQSQAMRDNQDAWIKRIYEWAKRTSGDSELSMSDVYVTKDMAALGNFYINDGEDLRRGTKLFEKVVNTNKAIQDFHLAGGAGMYNAFTLRNALTLWWQDPIRGTKAMVDNFKNASSNRAVKDFFLQNQEKLLKYALDSGDFDNFLEFSNILSLRDDQLDGNAAIKTVTALADMPTTIRDADGNIIKKADAGFKSVYDEIFNTPTFARWMLVAKADLQMRNYDKATRYVERMMKRHNLTDEDFATIDGGMGSKDKYIAHLAYMRTEMYWHPSWFVLENGNTNKVLKRIQAEDKVSTMDSLRAIRTENHSFKDAISSFFFAVDYKIQMNAHPILGAFSWTMSPITGTKAFMNAHSHNSLRGATGRFAGGGNRTQAMTMLGIIALAHAWNKSIGAPSAVEDIFAGLDEDKRQQNLENGTYGLSRTLMNLQDLGKFWLPNTGDGRFNPNKTGNGVDPFFSIFTLQNTAARTVNKTVNANNIPVNWQRSSGPAGLLGKMTGNQDLVNFGQTATGIAEEAIGSNLLNGWKALYEIFVNSTYFGNNIWERKYMPDGTVNKNYNPLRNIIATGAHYLNLDKALSGTGYNTWVKGLDMPSGAFVIGEEGVRQDKTGTVSGTGILQHEYITAAEAIAEGEYFDALADGMELPFKTRNYLSQARTDLNQTVMLALRTEKEKYDRVCTTTTDVGTKDKAYAEFASKAVSIVQSWSEKHGRVLGDNNEMTSTATKLLVSMLADEYNDETRYRQSMYDKLSDELKMAAGDSFIFSKNSQNDLLQQYLAEGMSGEEAADKAAKMYNKHLTALKEAQVKEYEARQALREAGITDVLGPVFDTAKILADDTTAKSNTLSKKVALGIKSKFLQPVGEFANYKEFKEYTEEQIANAATTKEKVKLAESYNDSVVKLIQEDLEKYGGNRVLNSIYWDGEYGTNMFGDYVIIPADKTYRGKSPRSNYLKDLLGIGYRNSENLPSDEEVNTGIKKVRDAMAAGRLNSASALIDNLLVQSRKGVWHSSDEDYQNLLRLKSLISSRSKR